MSEVFVSHFRGIDPMAKRKIQQGATSGGGILSYMHKVGKMSFYQKTFKNDPTLKNFPNTQSKMYRNIPEETQEPY
jgi:hypothetical protein